MALPGRLDAVVSLVPADALRVADIGYDHGYALVLLAEKLPKARLFGVERIPGAARRFYTQSATTHLLDRIELFDGDGFRPLSDLDLDAAVLAGMGEATILTIVSQHPAPERLHRLVVCTPQMPAVLRPAFSKLGFGVLDERLAFDGRRYYEVVAFERGLTRRLEPLEALFGPELLKSAHMRDYLRRRREDWKSLLTHRGAGLVPPDTWPDPTPDSAGAYQQIKVRALDEALRRVPQS